jgi:hypothetical protein
MDRAAWVLGGPAVQAPALVVANAHAPAKQQQARRLSHAAVADARFAGHVSSGLGPVAALIHQARGCGCGYGCDVIALSLEPERGPA